MPDDNPESNLSCSFKNSLTSDKFNDLKQLSHDLKANLRKLELDRAPKVSFDHSNERAMYVSDWLDGENYPGASYPQPSRGETSPDLEDYHLGQVIGVRETSANVASRQGDNRYQQSAYNKLKFDHDKLQREYGLLESQLKMTKSKYNHLFKRKNNDIDILKLLIAQAKKKSALKETVDDQSSNIMTSRIDISMEIEELRNENKRLQAEAERIRSDFAKLTEELRFAKSDSAYRKLVQVQHENFQLKERVESDLREISALKLSFSTLEEQLQSIINEQKRAENEKNEEVSKAMAELYRIQVDQAKLKMDFNNELEKKQELNRQLNRLEEERTSLNEQLDSYRIDLRLEKSRTKKDDLKQVEQLVAEANKWREKFEQTKCDKSGLEDLLRSSKLRCSQMDSSHQDELELLRDLNRLELNKLNGIKLKLEEENRLLTLKLEEEETRRGQLEIDNQKLDELLLETKKQLEIVLIDKRTLETASSKLAESERRLEALDDKVESLESNLKAMLDERASDQEKLANYRKQIQEMRQTIRLQRKANAEMVDDKEKELVKLRLQRNIKQQSRQLALLGIKNELKSSLDELKAIKCRFTRRLINDS